MQTKPKQAPKRSTRAAFEARAGSVKRSVTIRADLDERAHALVGDGGFSNLVNEGLARAIQARMVKQFIGEYETKHGVISAKEIANVLRTAKVPSR